jgi:CRISPR-associated endonuclease Csn1
MTKILGIDAGTHSAGWAIRDANLADNQIIDYGVITFEKGVATEKGNEFPKVQKRTESRGQKHNYQAEKYRKWGILEFLMEKGMCPLTLDELNKWRKYTKGQKRNYPQSEKYIQWLRFDFDGDGKPDFYLFEKGNQESYYIFRTMSIDENSRHIFQSNPMILGRVFYQLVQRRGFRGRDEEEAKIILQGSEKAGTEGRDKIADYISKYKTLGAALYYYQKENGGRIRQRYNLRKDYEEELKLICQTHDISDNDYQKLWKAIIWQRPLRTQKGLVGSCIYEKNKKRAPISHPLYEEYRTWVFINNLKIEVPEYIDKIQYLKEKVYPIFYKSSNDFELSSVIKQLDKDKAKMNAKFNSKTKVVSAKLLKSFQDVLGEDWKEKYDWNNINDRNPNPQKKTTTNYTYEDIWHVLNTFDGQENLKAFAVEKLGLDDEKAEKLSKIKLNQGYATLSLSAIKKIIPFLQKGFLYNHAVYLANLHKVLGSNEISNDLINYFSEEIEKITQSNQEQKILNTIVNSLIQDELNSEYRYSIEISRELDSSELSNINNKIQGTFGEKTWNEFDEEKKSEILNYISAKFKEFLKKSVLSKQNVFVEQPRLHEQIFSFMKDAYDISDSRKKYLWHPSEQENYATAQDYKHYVLGKKDIFLSEDKINKFLAKNPHAEYQGRSIRLLGDPEPLSKGLKNPMALKSLHKIKQLINYLLKTGKIDEDTRIVIEIARELNDANRRKAIERWNNEREKENETFKNIIREINEECGTNFDENDKTLIQKIRLWEEQKRQCLYTGKNISYCDVFNGSKYDIEHTIPASISFDNELKNLTLADTDYNRKIKGKKYPTQLPNYDDDAEGYTAIKPRLKFIEEKVKHLENLYDEWKKKATYASTKEIKDTIIQRYHMVKFDLDYWKSKLHTFTLEEYKSSWRNSQLRDTQIITKYALPYLKTVFNKVSVEKASVVDAFKEIYNVKLSDDKKDRSVHYHHAIDAAVLTLIPPFYERDKILLKYNEAKDKKIKIYHEKPIDWGKFEVSKINFIKDNILINNLSENKTLLETYKKVRKRGKIEYLRHKDEKGKWIYQKDEKGNKIPKVAKGDTIRGQLHGESLYGAIKQPLRDENNKIIFDENNKMILQDDIYLVMRKELKYKKDANSLGFKSLDEIKNIIVDKDLFKIIKQQVETFEDFKTAMNNGIYMLDQDRNRINRIRHIRCFESMKYNTAVKVHTHSFKSDKEYKHYTLAKNGENTLCLYYKQEKEKGINVLSISQVAELKFKNDKQYFEEPYYNQIEKEKGKNKISIQLYTILRVGQKVLFYKNSIEELHELSTNELSKRMFKITKFEDGKINFRNHLIAGIDTELRKDNEEYTEIDIEKNILKGIQKKKGKIIDNPIFLRLSQKEWNFAIDGVDFIMNMDGTIKFKF